MENEIDHQAMCAQAIEQFEKNDAELTALKEARAGGGGPTQYEQDLEAEQKAISSYLAQRFLRVPNRPWRGRRAIPAPGAGRDQAMAGARIGSEWRACGGVVAPRPGAG